MDTTRETALLQSGQLLNEHGALLRAHLAPHRIGMDADRARRYQAEKFFNRPAQTLRNMVHELGIAPLRSSTVPINAGLECLLSNPGIG